MNEKLSDTNRKLDEILEFLKRIRKEKIDREFWNLFNTQTMDDEFKRKMREFRRYYDVMDGEIFKKIEILSEKSNINISFLIEDIKNLHKIENNFTIKNTLSDVKLSNEKILTEMANYARLYAHISNQYNKCENILELKCEDMTFDNIKVDGDCKATDFLTFPKVGEASRLNKTLRENENHIKTYEEIIAFIKSKNGPDNARKEANANIEGIKRKYGINSVRELEEYIKALEAYEKIKNNKILFDNDKLNCVIKLLLLEGVCSFDSQGLTICNSTGLRWKLINRAELTDDVLDALFFGAEKYDDGKIVNISDEMLERLKIVINSINLIDEDMINKKIPIILGKYFAYYNQFAKEHKNDRDLKSMLYLINEIVKKKRKINKTYKMMIFIIGCFCAYLKIKFLKGKPAQDDNIWTEIGLEKDNFIKSYIIHTSGIKVFVDNYELYKGLEGKPIKNINDLRADLKIYKDALIILEMIEDSKKMEREIEELIRENENLRRRIRELGDSEKNIREYITGQISDNAENIQKIKTLLDNKIDNLKYPDVAVGGTFENFNRVISQNIAHSNETTDMLFEFNKNVQQLKSLINKVYNKLNELNKKIIFNTLTNYYIIMSVSEIVEKNNIKRYTTLSEIQFWKNELSKYNNKDYELLINVSNEFLNKIIELGRDKDKNTCIDLEKIKCDQFVIIIIIDFIMKQVLRQV